MPRASRLGDTPRARQLGAALREHRDAQGISTRKLATLLGTYQARVSRWESGNWPPDEVLTASILGALGVTGEDRERLLELARGVADPNWFAPGVGRQLGALLEYERSARSICEVNPLLIPGLLQTADYARNIMLQSGTSSGQADHWVALRVSRREILTRRTSPVRFEALIGEHAIRYGPCPDQIMADQLHHIQELAGRTNVTVHIVPLRAGWSPLLEGMFVVIEFERLDPVVQIEHHRSGVMLTDRGGVRSYQSAADTVRQVALSPEDSAGLIAEVIDDLEHGP